MTALYNLLRVLRHHLGNVLRFIYLSYLRLNGIKIGRKTMISLGVKIDLRRGTVIIGDECVITHGVVILSHDYAAMLMGSTTSESQATTHIGNRVFIGVNSIILPGVHIGSNTIIGAGSVVKKDIPSNSIAVGNPAVVVKKINSLKK